LLDGTQRRALNSFTPGLCVQRQTRRQALPVDSARIYAALEKEERGRASEQRSRPAFVAEWTLSAT